MPDEKVCGCPYASLPLCALTAMTGRTLKCCLRSVAGIVRSATAQKLFDGEYLHLLEVVVGECFGSVETCLQSFVLHGPGRGFEGYE